ncbi:HK97 gp10 family phage protein [Pseudomonas aeruginosa]|uniref:HK97-gp10 family putative phage morphogenesis protein n=1 Tax=Pseudomonas aeruginosa TaxID=287 RepID=UPI0002CBE3F7|nr:HK97-gp10 family putative phage morphogenesis protein [Pseudomonas aeruginosa]EJO5057942.1 HK97 gp10 family phage protein [Pseudomonas aeruginosa]EMZ49604.1 HK97 gp10 family phage protein [Pseudomonas aeruginosa str. Stone 130]MCS8418306.1 HK97 gp10 family phage protein [Pseudomonas aeruginosa]MCS9171232.1 HK97 gp10 family phage protein [Pseudomonas aeruginosa]
MADTVEFSITGLDSLLGKLDSVTEDVKRRGGRAALRKAAMIVVQAAKQGAAKIDDPGTGRSISDNIALRWNGRLFKRTGDLGFRIGVLHGAVLPKKGERSDKSANAPTPHWRLLEFGTEDMRAHPFMRSALADNIAEVTSTFVSEYEKGIDRAIKRAAKKAAQV